MLSLRLVFALVAATAVGVCSAKTIHRTFGTVNAVDASEWAHFKIKYSKFYATERDEARRFAIWHRNKKFVDNYDTSSSSFSVKLNHLADLDSHEIVRLSKPGRKTVESAYSFEYVPTSSLHDSPLPTQFDWRDKNAIGPVENQGEQGSSAAAVVLDVLESQYVITLKNPFAPLSMAEIQRCCLDKTSPWSTSPERILKCVQDAKGIEFATCPKANGKLRFSDDCKVNPDCVAEQIKAWAVVPNQNETLMAEALVNDGPLVALIDASPSSFQFYKSGVYDDGSCSKSTINHAVLIVGYGVQASGGTPYWIAKNSWGVEWGNAGYIWIKRGANTCAIATAPTNVFVQA